MKLKQLLAYIELCWIELELEQNIYHIDIYLNVLDTRLELNWIRFSIFYTV